jgi:hypothetical protein
VSSILRIIGLRQERHFVNFHRVLNRAVWSSRQAAVFQIRSSVGRSRNKNELILPDIIAVARAGSKEMGNASVR